LILEDIARQIIDIVHEYWTAREKRYPAGYAVFYSALRRSPTILLLGLNPGGDGKNFSREKENPFSKDQPMEYIVYGGKNGYKLAQRNVRLFESIGKKDLLRGSVKTNINFFRSKKWSDLTQEDTRFCEDMVFKVIRLVQPKVLLCESLFVLRKVIANLYEGVRLNQLHEYVRGNRRKYLSYLCNIPALPKLLIGITHLTGSWPSREDIEEIENRLISDLKLVA
jgi:hypothetical protein